MIAAPTLHLPVALRLVVLLGAAVPLCGQPQRPAPHIGFVYPAGGQQGTTVTVAVGGQNLGGAAQAYLSGTGLQAKIVGFDRPLSVREQNDLREEAQKLQEKRAAARADPANPRFTAADEKRAVEIRELFARRGNRQASPAIADTVTLEITIAREAEPGERELRLRATNGVTNPMVFCVGQLPETTEPVVMASARRPGRGGANAPRSGPRKTDTEITLPATVNGQIMPGEVDRYRFTARRGQRITVAASARALIPYLADAVPGWFQATLALYDAQGREVAYDDDYRFNPDPVLLREIPADGAYTIEIKDAIYRGREDFVYRFAIGELPFVTGIHPLGASIGGRSTFELGGWNLSSRTLAMDTAGHRPGTFLLSVRHQAILSNPVKLALDSLPECTAAEPHNDAAHAQPLTLPVIVNGRIERPGDEDWFRLEGKAGDEIVAEVLARRLGSPLDSVLTVLDATGKPLATNDDHEDKSAGLLTHQADSRLTCRLPADGSYTLRLADTQRQGGPEFGYRLRIGAPRPGFQLRVAPSTLNLRPGGSAALTVYALRQDGFDGEIVLGMIDPPRGFALQGARIPPGQDKVQLTLTAPPTTRDEPHELKIGGRGVVEGKLITHAAVPAEDMMQAFAYRHLVPARELKVHVGGGRAAGFRPALQKPLQIPLGGEARVRIATPSVAGVTGFQFEVNAPAEGLVVQGKSAGAGWAELVVSCDPAKLKQGAEGNLLLNAFAQRAPGQKQKAGGRQPMGVVPAIPFEIVAGPSFRVGQSARD